MNIKKSAFVSRGQIASDPIQCPLCGSQPERFFRVGPDRLHLRKELYEMVRCVECTLVWVNNPPAPEKMPYHYGSDYHRGITSTCVSSPSRWRRRAMVLKHKQSGNALDLGCSSGGFLETLKGGDWQLSGVEIDRSCAAVARERTGASVVTGDLLEARFPTESFDVITCFHVLEHHADPVSLFKQVGAWLKPGGMFFIAIPNFGAWESTIFRSYWYGLELPRHLFHYSPTSLRRLASITGFEEVELSTRPDSYMEHSARYLIDRAAEVVGISRVPLAAGEPASFPLKVIRKLLRITIAWPFTYVASAAGAGASIEGAFRKSRVD